MIAIIERSLSAQERLQSSDRDHGRLFPTDGHKLSCGRAQLSFYENLESSVFIHTNTCHCLQDKNKELKLIIQERKLTKHGICNLSNK